MSVSINSHTTASSPHPHILYNIHGSLETGQKIEVARRYSEFVALHESLRDSFTLPPKRLLATTFIPSAWVDDRLIAERKAGLAQYLTSIIQAPEYQSSPLLVEFLTAPSSMLRASDVEDVLPSTLSRNTGLKLQAEAPTLIASAYYPDWVSNSRPPEGINFALFDILFFAFATPNSSSTLNWDSGSQSTLRRLVNARNQSGKSTKIVLSVGGWGGSYWFSQAVNSSSHRSTFSNSLVGAVNSFGLDGVDIDWEYPNSQGSGNPHSPADAANFLSLLKTLRTALGASKLITAAVPQTTWLDASSRPLKNVAAYAAQLSYVNIMNYDVFGASSTPGPNAPLGNLCGTSSLPQYSAQAAFRQWTAAGFPAKQLLLGLPLYGYVSKSTKTHLTGSFAPELSDEEGLKALNGAHAHVKDANNSAAVPGDLSWSWGQQIAFNRLLAAGALMRNANGTYSAANGYTEGWDDCSDTPFLFNQARTTVVTYDDTYSLKDKAAYAKQSGMAGCFTWSLDQDDGVALQKAIRAALGK